MERLACMLQRRGVLAILTGNALAWSTGCVVEPAGRLGVWAVDDTVRVMPDAEPSADTTVFEEATRRVSIAAAISAGEFTQAHKQLARGNPGLGEGR